MTKKNNQTTTSLTPDQQAIADRANAQSKTWHTIREDELNDFSLMTNVLDLPEAAASLQKREIYAFRWCARTPDRIDELTRSAQPPLRWGLVTRTTIPELASMVDSMLGGICRLDQILLYKPWSHHVIVQKAKMDLAEVGLQTGSLEGKKHQMQDKRSDVEVMSGSDQKIGGSDVVMADESIIDNAEGHFEDDTPLGDLVE